MILRRLLLASFLALAATAWGQEQAFTNRSTELKDRAAAEAATLKTLPENTEVKVIQRSGGWTRVDSGGQAGWVRVFHLRFPATAQAAESGGGLGSLTSALGFGKQRSQTTTIATTGIRGLSPEDLKNASPDGAALAKAQSYRADKPAAERFAREGKLADVKVDYQ
jgi:hypothetical protein